MSIKMASLKGCKGWLISGALDLKLIFLLLIGMLSHKTAFAQHEGLLEYFEKGKTEGHIRNFYMHTNNRNFTDYYANATGGFISYTTKPINGFQAGIAGVFTFKTFSSDLHKKDPLTNRSARWEKELFDLNDEDNYYDLDRLEELFLKYSFKNSYVAVGKFPIEHHPLINKSDGRMKIFAYKGIATHYEPDSSKAFNLTAINGVSPRSFTEWFSLNEAIGLLNNGFQPNGDTAFYEGQTNSRALISAGIERKYQQLSLNVWSTHLDRILHTHFLELELNKPKWQFGIQYSIQFPYEYQQRLAYKNRYIQTGERGQLLSLKLGYKKYKVESFIAITRAFSTGRYLFPRELGRDQFYTSIARSRVKGLGNSTIYRWHFAYVTPINHLKLKFDASTLQGPGANNYKYNKYGIDNYYQFNTCLEYSFDRWLKGTRIELLHIWKENTANSFEERVFNQSDYQQWNIISNFNF